LRSINPATSSVHPPNFDLIKSFKEENWRGRITKKTVNIQGKILDKITKENSIDVDFIKIDTQGSELEILQGSKDTLLKNCFGCTVETWTLEVFKKQYLSYDIMKFLQENGFLFFDFQVGAAWKRKYLDENFHGKRQIIGMDFLYLKSPEAFFRLDPSIEKTAKAIAIADVWGFPDYALQLIEHYEKKYTDSSLNFLKLEIINRRKKSRKDKYLEKFFPNYILDMLSVRYFNRKPSFPNIH